MKQSAAKSQHTNTCIYCKKEKPIQDFTKDKSAANGYRNTCKVCYNTRAYDRPNYRKKRNQRVAKFRKTYRGSIDMRMRSAKVRAQKEGIPFDLDIEFLINLYESQGGKCALSGKKLNLVEGGWWDKASLDKDIPELGYVKGNVQFLSQRVNLAKNNLSTEEFILMCKSIVEKSSTTIPNGSTSQANGDGSGKQQDADDIV